MLYALHARKIDSIEVRRERCQAKHVGPAWFVKKKAISLQCYRMGYTTCTRFDRLSPTLPSWLFDRLTSGRSVNPSCGSTFSAGRILLFFFLYLRLLFGVSFVLLRRRMDLVVKAVMNTTIPAICSAVHTLLNKKKLKKSVVAFRAVLVIDMVSAPKFLVIAAEQDDPKNPMELNSTMTEILLPTDQVRSSNGTPSRCCW